MPSSPLATLTARGLDVAAGPHVLLAGVDLVLAPGARVGLVGPNGAGKSTLLRTLAGLHPPESGTVTTAPPAATVGYLPQEPAPRPGETVRAMLARRTGVAAASAALDRATAELDEGDPSAIERYSRVLERWMALGGADLDARTATVAEEVGLGADLLDRPTAALSGGQAARAGLASLLLARYDVFLLDEPTNDLDLDGLERLERFVLGLRGPAVLVSHDRAFLERTVTAVAEIDAHARTLTRYEGGWHAYLEERARARRRAEERYARYAARRAELQERARVQRQWSGVGEGRARRSGETDKFIRHHRVQTAQRVAARARAAEDALDRLPPVEKPWDGWDLRLRIAVTHRAGDVVARLTDAVVHRSRPDGAPAFTLGPVSLEVGWGDRLALVGPNGSGKTTLLHALLGRLPLDAGDRWVGPGVVVGEIGQRRDAFEPAPTLLAGFQAATGLAAVAEARSALAAFGLSATHVGRPPGSLSPGERTRAELAVLQVRGVNLLVLDEPTNHLDIEAIEQLEQALAGFPGTLVVVTHDRRLLEAVGPTRVVDVAGGRVTERR